MLAPQPRSLNHGARGVGSNTRERNRRVVLGVRWWDGNWKIQSHLHVVTCLLRLECPTTGAESRTTVNGLDADLHSIYSNKNY